MTQSHRMGWPAALNCIPLETRKAHVTPPREVRGVLQTFFEAADMGVYLGGITEADCRQIKTNGAAQPKTTGAPDTPSKQGDDGWVTHSGGCMPVDKETVVDLRFRDGDERLGRLAGEYHDDDKEFSNWIHAGDGFDITAYRIVKDQA